MSEFRDGDIEAFFGCAPDFTGGKPTNEYLAEVRGEEHPWISITGKDKHMPLDGRWLVTIENQDGKRKVTVLNWNQLWASQKVVAYKPLPEPYTGE